MTFAAALLAFSSLYSLVAILHAAMTKGLSEKDTFLILVTLNLVGSVLFAYALYAGRKWARTAVLVLAGFATLKATPRVAAAGLRHQAMPALSDAVLLIAPPVLIVVLLMLPSTRRWYSAMGY
ncbi:MAG TPA: hypothetical protein VF331_11420 [Polyangiales bacterium]